MQLKRLILHRSEEVDKSNGRTQLPMTAVQMPMDLRIKEVNFFTKDLGHINDFIDEIKAGNYELVR